MPKRKKSEASVSESSNAGLKKRSKKRSTKETSSNSAVRLVEETDEDSSVLDTLDQTFLLTSYAAILKPLKDVKKSFDLDLFEALSRLSDDVLAASQSKLPVNFSEAAVILQSCCNIYGKRVDHLYNLVHGLNKLVTDVTLRQRDLEKELANEAIGSNEETEECQGSNESGPEKRNVKLKRQGSAVSNKLMDVVFETQSPDLDPDFMPDCSEDQPPLASLVLKDTVKGNEEFASRRQAAAGRKMWDVFFQANANKSPNNTVLDSNGEIIGKRCDFCPQTCWIQSELLLLSQVEYSALVQQSATNYWASSLSQPPDDQLVQLDLERPLRVLSRNSYHSCVSSTSMLSPKGSEHNQDDQPISPQSLEPGAIGEDSALETPFGTPRTVDEEVEELVDVNNVARDKNSTPPACKSSNEPDFLATPDDRSNSWHQFSDDSLSPAVIEPAHEDNVTQSRGFDSPMSSGELPKNCDLSPGLMDRNSNIIKPGKVSSQGLSVFADVLEQSKLHNEVENETILKLKEPEARVIQIGGGNIVRESQTNIYAVELERPELAVVEMDSTMKVLSRLRVRKKTPIWNDEAEKNKRKKDISDSDSSDNETLASIKKSKFDRGTGIFISDTETSQNVSSQPSDALESDRCSEVSFGCFPNNRLDERQTSFANPHVFTFDPTDVNPATPLNLTPVHILDSPVSRFSTPEPITNESDCSIDYSPYLPSNLVSHEPDDGSFEVESNEQSKWEDRILPHLRREETKPKFDIADTSRSLVKSLKKRKDQTCDFADLFSRGSEVSDVSRMFVSCLGLASTGNIEIKQDPEKFQTFGIELKKSSEDFTTKELLDLPTVQKTAAPSTSR